MSTKDLTVKLDWSGDHAAAEVERAGRSGLESALEFVLEEANRTIPHREGTMQRSGQVSMDKRKPVGTVSYDTPYAPRQHEDLHARHASGRRAKWLQLTLEENMSAIADYLKKGLSGAFGGK